MLKSNILSVEKLSCIRGERALFEDLSFELSNGQALHVRGMNGSGKTSLLRLLCGINQPEQGAINWNGISTNNNLNFFKCSVYIGHKDGLKNELSSIENLRVYQKVSTRTTSAADEQKLDACLAQLQILDCADLYTHQLSFGQRRRLTFARLLLNEFNLWILDEPFTGIDREGRALIEKLCEQHLNDGGLIVLTHHQSLENSAFKNRLNTLDL